jgi:hypothetical protein
MQLMEKSFALDQKETVLLTQLDQERTQALAMVGALSLDMEQARKNLDTAAERQRSFIRQALIARGVERFDNARVQNGSFLVTVPDAMPLVEGGGLTMVERVNGPVAEVKE